MRVDMNSDKISLIVPVYNAENFLARCLESLLVQSHRNLEILVINDGSEDRSLDILRAYEKKDGRIRVLDRINGGVASARNTGLDCLTGDLVGFVDSDDYVAPTMFEALYLALTDQDADIAECGYWTADAQGRPVQAYPLQPALYQGSEAVSLHYAKKDNGSYFCCNKLYRAELVKDLRFWPLRFSEDYLFNLHAHAKSQRKVCIADPAYYYVHHPESATSIPFSEAKLDILKAGVAAGDYYKAHWPDLYPYAALYTANYARLLYLRLKESDTQSGLVYIPELLDHYRLYFDQIKGNLRAILPSRRKRLVLRLFRRSPGLYLALRKCLGKKS